MEIKYSKSAMKFIEKQNKDTQNRIMAAIEKIPAGDIVKLKGADGYRLRVGDFRVLYAVRGNNANIIDIDNRGQVYK